MVWLLLGYLRKSKRPSQNARCFCQLLASNTYLKQMGLLFVMLSEVETSRYDCEKNSLLKPLLLCNNKVKFLEVYLLYITNALN